MQVFFWLDIELTFFIHFYSILTEASIFIQYLLLQGCLNLIITELRIFIQYLLLFDTYWSKHFSIIFIQYLLKQAFFTCYLLKSTFWLPTTVSICIQYLLLKQEFFIWYIFIEVSLFIPYLLMQVFFTWYWSKHCSIITEASIHIAYLLKLGFFIWYIFIELSRHFYSVFTVKIMFYVYRLWQASFYSVRIMVNNFPIDI